MTACIYGIKNNINSKYYIGQTINFTQRKSRHKLDLINNTHHNKHLQNSFNKYGIENFSFEILEVVEDHKLLGIRELDWIEKIGYYNSVRELRETFCEKAIQNMKYSHTGTISDKRIFSKQSIEFILSIDEFIGECQRPLSKIYNCSKSTIAGICKRKSYRDISEQYDKLEIGERLNILKKALVEIKYCMPQGGGLYGVLIYYLAFDEKLSNAEIARKLDRTSRTISRVLKQEVLPKSREIYSTYDKEVLKELYKLYVNNIVLSH